jgi:hypothetical protein
MTDDNVTDGLGGVAKFLGGGLTALVAMATAIGASTGALPRLFLNHGVATAFAFLLAIIAVACGLLAAAVGSITTSQDRRRVMFLVLGIVAFSASLVAIVGAQVIMARQEVDRPIITGSWKQIEKRLIFEITTKASGVRAGKNMQTRVRGSVIDPTQPPGERAGTVTLYYGSTGPDPEGRAEQTAQILVPRELTSIDVASTVGGRLEEGCKEPSELDTRPRRYGCMTIDVPEQIEPVG